MEATAHFSDPNLEADFGPLALAVDDSTPGYWAVRWRDHVVKTRVSYRFSGGRLVSAANADPVEFALTPLLHSRFSPGAIVRSLA